MDNNISINNRESLSSTTKISCDCDFEFAYPAIPETLDCKNIHNLNVQPESNINIQLSPKAVTNNLLHPNYETRYVIIDEKSGIVLDDNYGYGYKTATAAHRAYGYRNRDTSKDADKDLRLLKASNWLDNHQKFNDAMLVEFGIVKSKLHETGIDFNATYLKNQLKKYNLTIEGFLPRDLFKVWLDRNCED